MPVVKGPSSIIEKARPRMSSARVEKFQVFPPRDIWDGNLARSQKDITIRQVGAWYLFDPFSKQLYLKTPNSLLIKVLQGS